MLGNRKYGYDPVTGEYRRRKKGVFGYTNEFEDHTDTTRRNWGVLAFASLFGGPLIMAEIEQVTTMPGAPVAIFFGSIALFLYATYRAIFNP